MEYRRLGRSGLKVSALSFGSWVTFHNQLNEKSAMECMALAYDRGVNFYDNAEVYAQGQSEIMMGSILKKLKYSRDSLIVSSKAFWGGDRPTQRGLSRKHLVDACHGALKRLQLDYLDLFFCHRPDRETPIEETVYTMDHLVKQGKILYWGTSEWAADEIMEAYAVARRYHLVPPTMEQPEYHMFHRDRVEKEYHRVYEAIGLGTTIWSPLASGILTGKYNDSIPSNSRANLKGFEWLKDKVLSDQGRQRIEKTKELQVVADALNITVGQLAISWCLRNPNVSTVILGASQKKQLEDNLKSLECVDLLTPQVIDKIENILDNRPEAYKSY